MEDFNKIVYDYISEKIDEYIKYDKNLEIYLCDFCYDITENVNIDGVFFYSTKKSIDAIKEWWEDCGDFFDYYKFNIGAGINPFENADRFVATMIIEGCHVFINNSLYDSGKNIFIDKDEKISLKEWYNNNYNKNVILDEDILKKLKECFSEYYENNSNVYLFR